MGDEQLPEVMQAARFLVRHRKPYLAHALWAIIPRASDKLPPGSHAGVDKYWRLYYNPAMIAKCTVEECVAIWVHEMWHLLDNASTRQEVAKAYAMLVDPKSGAMVSAWNAAGDMSINSRMADETGDSRGDGTNVVPLPQWLYPKTFGYPLGLLTEEYYERLCKDTPPMDGGGSGAGNCGSGAAGQPQDYEDPAPEHGGFTSASKVNHIPGITAGEGEAIRRSVAEEVLKSQGTVPAWMELWADRLLHPVVDWRKVLAGVVRGSVATTLAGYAERTYRRPHRRSGVGGIVLPTWYRPTPYIAIIGDTSGSMGNELGRVLIEADAICKAVNATVVFMSVDAAVGAVQKVTSGREIKLVGGGGTDMGVGIAAACLLKPRPHLLIVITDCYTPWPKAVPTIPVIIATVTKDPDGLPAWAKVVNCHEDKP